MDVSILNENLLDLVEQQKIKQQLLPLYFQLDTN